MNDNEMRVSLSVEVDKTALARVKTAMQSVDGMTREAIRATTRLGDVARGDVAQGVREVGEAFEQVEQQARQSIDAIIDDTKRLASAKREAVDMGKGDALSRVRGGVEAISKPLAGTPLADGIGGVAQIEEVVNALPKLKEALSALPSAIGQAAATLGPVGIAAAAALAAVGLAIAHFAEESQKRAKELTQAVEAQRRVAQQVAEGMTTGEAEARLAEMNLKREAEAKLLADLQAQYDANINSAGLLAPVIKALSFEEEALIEQINKSKDAIGEMDAETAALEKALRSAALAANDAAAALAATLGAQQNVISDLVNGMTSTEAQGLIERARLNAEYQRAEIARLQALLETIATTDPRFKVVSEAIAIANKNLDAARGQIEAYSQALAEGKFAANDARAAAQEAAKAQEQAAREQEQAAREAARAQEQAAREAAKAQEDAARKAEQAAEGYRNAGRKLQEGLQAAERGFQEAMQNIAQKARERAQDMAKALSRDMLDMQQKAELARQDKLQEFARRDVDRLIKHQRNVDKIYRDANKSIEEAVRNQDALALARAVEAGKERLAEAEQANRDEIADARRANDQILVDLATSLRRQRAERLVDYQRAQADAREAQAREIRDAREARVKQLQLAREAYQKELELLREKFAAEVGLYQQLARAVSGGAPANPSPSPIAQPANRSASGITVNVNGSMNPSAVAGSVVQLLRRTGVV